MTKKTGRIYILSNQKEKNKKKIKRLDYYLLYLIN
jgi:hypothetical protein